MKNLVIGNKGQIGSAIQKILECEGFDIEGMNTYQDNIGSVLHITIPYSENFVEQVSQYADLLYSPLIIIHSTVPVGTCAKFDSKFNIVYSPCRGVHPELEKGIRIFDKYFAGRSCERASRIFSDKIDGQCIFSDSPSSIESLESAKLWDTTQYGWNIVLEKLVHKYCVEHNLDFNLVYTMFNKSYNEGYEKLGHPEYKKYVLEHREGKIGGHCVIPNLELLDSPIAQIIKDLNID